MSTFKKEREVLIKVTTLNNTYEVEKAGDSYRVLSSSHPSKKMMEMHFIGAECNEPIVGRSLFTHKGGKTSTILKTEVISAY